MTTPVRVAQVIGSTGLYGAEQWILTLLRYLPARRAEATIVNLLDSPRHTSAIVRAARDHGIRAMDLHTGGRLNPVAVVRLARLARRDGYHILHSHGYKADLTCLFAARLSGVKAVTTPHGWEGQHDRRLQLYESISQRALRFFESVCPLSPSLRNGLRQHRVPEHKIQMILNGVDIAHVQSVAPFAERQAGGTVIGYVGRLVTVKNVECLIRAFRLLQTSRHDLRLMVVGDGPHAAELQALASTGPGADFTGYRPDAIALMKGFDLFVLPSWEEGIPRCLMEAMAAGVPVVASDIPGNRELVEHGVTGLLFRPDRPEELAQAILATIERPDRAKDMARAARALVEGRFSAARMAEEYAALYERC